MVVLAAIGRFFKKIWDWIKQTAWIQPLLIVGIIFGVIFSIPSIVNAIKAQKEAANKYEAYYHDFQISLELENDAKDSSPADRFTYDLEKVMKGEPGAEEAFRRNHKELGDKFFVAYVAQDCDKCREAKEGFELLEEKLNKGDDYFKSYDKLEFNMVTIFTDEETSYTDSDETAFVKYLERHQSFFEEAGSIAWETEYCDKGHLSQEDLEALETADPVNFLTPTIFLVELGNARHESHPVPGVVEVMFGVSGSTEAEKATTLLDCWKHDGEFTHNPTK